MRRLRTLPWILAAGFLVLLLSISVGVAFGSSAIPLETVWSILLNKSGLATIEPNWSAGRESIIWDVRFPRAVLAVLVGAGLAVVGAVLQSATRNPLADPHLLGVSSGAAFGAILALLHVGPIWGLVTVPLFAFAGALVSTVLVGAVARLTHSASAERLVLAGVAVSFVVAACSNLLIFFGDPRAAHTVVFWMLGGLGLAQWSQLAYPALALLGCGTFAWLRARELNALALGDETALSLGIAVTPLRMQLFTVTALLTGAMVAFSGVIGFVGLMMPHFARMLTGSDNVKVIPVAALLGAIALIWADLAARVLFAPEDIPIGVVTGLAGGVAFIILLRQHRR